MSTCIEYVEDYKDSMVTVIQTKKSLVVAMFFTYTAYVVALMGKHILANMEDETKRDFSDKLGKIAHDISGKSFFFFYLTVVCSQVKSSVFAALLIYVYLGALGCQFVGGLCSGNVVLRKLRLLGLVMVFGLCFMLYWALLINDWCSMFYFKSMFSLKYSN